MPRKLPDLPALDFSGQTAIVTGTTHGLGLAVSKELILRNLSTLIMGVRDVKKGEEIKSRLLAGVNTRGATIHVLRIDLEDYQSAIDFSDQVKRLTTTVDIVILNAGVGGLNFEITKSGHEKMIQVNLLSNALLALELLPLLAEAAKAKSVPSRLTWVGSFVQADHSLTKSPVTADETVLGHFDNEKKFKSIARYSDSKLLTTMFVQELAQHIDTTEVIFNEVSPGPVNTNFGTNYPLILKVVFTILLATQARSISEAVKTYLHAISVAGKESHGKYLSDNTVSPYVGTCCKFDIRSC